jgi:hypothetical protein
MPDVMTPLQVEEALVGLAPDAIACIERTLRGTIRPIKAQVDCAWRVVQLARDREVAVTESEVDDLTNVLQLVSP